MQHLKGRTSLFLGKTDVGKSTLAKYLLGELLSGGERACFVDADIGQSALGVPGTVSMRIFEVPEDLENFKPERILFIGTVNPAKKFRMMIEATKKLVDATSAGGVSTILVDTTGLVLGPIGRALKLAKTRVVSPHNIVAIQRAQELEHILCLIKEARIYRLEASPLARDKSRAARIRYREDRFREYFKDSGTLRFHADKVEFISNGAFDIKASLLIPGTLVGLNSDDSTAALGVYKRMMNDVVDIMTPLKSTLGISRIVTGDVVLSV